MGDILRMSAEDQIQDYSTRFKALQGLYDAFLKDLLVSKFDISTAYATAQSFFGGPTIPFAAIDGTEFVQPLFDLLVFFAGSYACQGTLTFHPDQAPSVTYAGSFTKGATAVSTVAPVFITKVPEIDQQFFDPHGGEMLVERSLSDQYIIDNSSIADALMTFSEYFLAYRLAVSPVNKVRLLLMDRTLGGSCSSLLYDSAPRFGWERNLGMLGVQVDGAPVTAQDFTYCRHRLLHPDLGLPPPRGDYLRHAIFYLLERNPAALTLDEISRELGLDSDERRVRAAKFVSKSVSEGFIVERHGRYKLKDSFKQSWRRISHLVVTLGNQIFSEALPEDPLASRNRLQIRKDGHFVWLTTLDIALLSLFSLYMLIEECWRRRILLLGITKDTASRDFKRQLIPILWQAQLLKKPRTYQVLEQAPNTDRVILQAISHFNASQLPVPWATTEYDNAFRTMIPDRHSPMRADHVGGARRNRISLEGAFLKSYVQLTEAETDHKLRSNVLFIDRIAYPGFDGTSDAARMTFRQEYGGATEPVRVLLYHDARVPNPIQNLTMTILQVLTGPSVPEAFGHNKPLMVADKVAKFHQATFSQVIAGTTNWICVHPHLRSFIFYLSTFRERRASIEAFRRGQASE
jgi:hypothetical protein